MNKFKTIFSKKRLPIILGAVLALFIAFFLIGLVAKGLSGKGEQVKLVSGQNIFSSTEDPVFQYAYKNKANIFIRFANAILNIFSTKEDEKPEINVRVFQYDGREIDSVKPEIEYGQKDGKISLDLDHSRFQQELRPGKYKMQVEVTENGKTHTREEEFFWGVLAINTNKSIYLPNETAYIQMAALEDNGKTICNANLKLEITGPDNKTDSPEVKPSGECKGDNVTDVPDYFADYQVKKAGKYQMRLINLDNNYEITDYFEVRNSVEFDVERTGPTRIWPYADYKMKITIKANQDFNGEIIETVPMTFAVKEETGAKQEPNVDNYTKTIIWQLEIKKGETKELSYSIDFPNVSPYFYLLGPLKIGDWQESRNWQIAADSETEVWITYDTAPSGSCGQNCWTVPIDWSASNSVEVIGAGGTGGDGATNNGAAGGGGGGYSKGINLTLSGDITFGVGASGSQPTSTGTGGNGGDTWFNATSLADCETVGSASGGGNGCVGAQGGKGGQGSGSGQAGGIGGLAANGVGNTARYSGGTGGAGSGNDGNGGGGGAAGPLIATDGDGHTGGAGSSAEGGGGGGAGGASAADGSASDTPNANRE